MPVRCPAADTLDVDGVQVELRCVHWSDDPDGHHPEAVHLVHTRPLDDDHTWPNTNPLPKDPPASE